ncbi:hypothetical protein [Pontibacter pudoricolor]|nr:hypothetical protein [Pontibacter pudoricolor]
MAVLKVKFIEPKKQLHFMRSGFFNMVDHWIELSDHFHQDFAAFKKFLKY